MLIKSRSDGNSRSSEITSHTNYLNRRSLLKLGALSLVSAKSQFALANSDCNHFDFEAGELVPTPLKSITHYNNYYEFSPDKEAVATLAQALTLEPWTIKIFGAVEKEITVDLDQIRALCEVERIYRLRCVEGWSMVIPWRGIELRHLLALAKPLAKAKFVRFTSVERPSEMIGQRRPTLNWPYREALRIDEATHPLTLLATGLYGQDLPKQNGAPLRLVVPWKYGFKSAKAIQSLELLDQQPSTTWIEASPKEYGFYANVNPAVAHPRWSQRREVRIGATKKIKTLPFNGYAEQVAPLYAGMDLNKFY